MAIHANSTPAPERTLLREVAAPGRLLPRPVTQEQRGAAPRQSELLAILDAGPLPFAYATKRQQRAMQASIDALIDYLDAIDADPDLEDGADDELSGDESEPSLGAPDHMMSCKAYWWGMVDRVCDQTHWAKGGQHDLEQVNEDGGNILDEPHDEEGGEPSLGALEIHHDQTGWSRGGCSDGEVDESDDEPSLGSLHNIEQQTWAQGSGSIEGDFDELRAPIIGGEASYERARRYHDQAGALLDRHGVRRGGNVGTLVPISLGGLWCPR